MVANYDVCIVGAGLIGLATARALLDRFGGASVLVVDKEDRVAAHQSGRNSGVVHSGLYYSPGSLKAKLCVEGRDEIYDLCREANIPVNRTGKLVVATRRDQLGALDELERRGRANGLVGLRRIGPAEINEVEPAAAGIAALHVPEAGIADFPRLAEHLAEDLQRSGAELRLQSPLQTIDHSTGGASLVVAGEQISVKLLVSCAGVHADRIAALSGVQTELRMVPFRGEYYEVSGTSADLVRHLIYPVPDPRFPFLGVHFTRRIDGTVEIGPNAVLALGREQYRGDPPVWRDLKEAATTRGLWRLGSKHWRAGLREVAGSRSRRAYARVARSLVPALRSEDLRPGRVGIRAQAITREGGLVDDFVIEEAGATVHVINAPSPGATACLAIGRYIAAIAETRLRSAR